MRDFIIIVAYDKKTNGIGNQGKMPDWPHTIKSNELQYFKQVTLECKNSWQQNAVIMGHNTWTHDLKSKPLPGRLNIVLKSDQKTKMPMPMPMLMPQGSLSFESLNEALLELSNTAWSHVIDKVFVIGGQKLYDSSIMHQNCIAVFTSLITTNASTSTSASTSTNIDTVKYDTFFKHDDYIKNNFILEASTLIVKDQLERNEWRRCYKDLKQTKQNKNVEEVQYLSLIKQILDQGSIAKNRTGTDTIKIFGSKLEFSLLDGTFPLLTTKEMKLKLVAEELFWMLRGSTDSKELSKLGNNIWKADGSRESLDKRGLKNNQEGDLGPIYGFQWRHFGAKYKDCQQDYKNLGFDQIAKIVEILKSDNKSSRRIVLSAWNPPDLAFMSLPPCHMTAIFNVEDNKYLSCALTMRSADVGLGVPFNIASYALLTIMFAWHCNLEAKKLVCFFADTHIYVNHIDALKKQLKNEPMPFWPKLTIKADRQKKLWEYTMADLCLENYTHWPRIAMKLSF